MSVLKDRLSRNTLALLISNGGSALLSFGLSVLIGRLLVEDALGLERRVDPALIGRVLGQEGLGVYAAALAWVFPLSLLAEMGIGTLITRDIAQTPDAAHAYVRQSVRVRLPSSTPHCVRFGSPSDGSPSRCACAGPASRAASTRRTGAAVDHNVVLRPEIRV